MTDLNDLRSLDICAIGLGQGGGNLAAEWRRRGYRSLLINTARADLRALSHHEGLDVPDKLVLEIGQGGTEGAGKDPEYGMACVRAHADEIRSTVEKHLRGADAFLLCAGLGGGTGSALPELVRVLAPLDVPFITLTTLPSSAESGIAKVNAVKTANALVSAELAGRMFIDNDRLVESFPDLDVVSYFPAVNARVLASLDELNRLNRRGDLWSIRTFDGEDLRKVLLSGGILQSHVAKLSSDSALDVEYLVDVVSSCVDGGDHLARGLDISKTAYLALVVVGPEKALRSTAMQVFDDAVRELKQRTGGGAVYEGLYVAPDDAPLKAYVLSASFSLPDRVGQLLEDARAEGSELARKIQQEIAPLALDELEGLSLFRSPSRRPPAQRVPPPEPRPLGEQIAKQVRELTRPRVSIDELGLSALDVSRLDETPLARAPDDADLSLADVPAEDSLEEPSLPDASELSEPSIPSLPSEPSEPSVPSELSEDEEASAADEEPVEQPTAAPAEVSVPAEAAEGGEDYRPRVGTGRYDDADEPLEPTRVAQEGEAVRPGLVSIPSVAHAEATEALPPAPSAPAKPKGRRPTPIRPQTGRATRLPDDVRVQEAPFDEQPAPPPPVADGHEGNGSPLTDPRSRAPFLHAPVSEDEDEDEHKTRTDARPSWLGDAAAALSSISGSSGTELQAVYEDLVDRFRQAADKRDKERVGRRLVDDAQADDAEVRALAVWAMVKLGDPAFKRALVRCSNDAIPEIARMAKEGLAALS